jgi:signal transduction histidine kinase
LAHGSSRRYRGVGAVYAAARKGAPIGTEAQLPSVQPALGRLGSVVSRPLRVRYVVGVLALAAAYYGSAKLGQSLRYTASVSAIWPPAGVGVAALYLWGLRWWPGVLIAELVINAELAVGSDPLPLGSLIGQQAGNMAEVLVGAILLRRLLGSGAALDRVEQVAGMFAALAIATAISATIGMTSMLAGGVISGPEAPTFWRTWWLGDLAGALVVTSLLLAWVRSPAAALRRMHTWEGGLLIATVAALGAVAVSTAEPVTYVVFPALIWAAFRFGPPGATLAIVIATGVAIGVTANDVGPFSKQPIDHRTLSTQIYIVVTALTTLIMSAVVGERERSAKDLAEAKRQEGVRAIEERHRIARDLHDSVSQALFSTRLHTRTAQRELEREGASRSSPLAKDLLAITRLTRAAQTEMRALIFDLGRDPLEGGLVAALATHASELGIGDGLTIDDQVADGRLPLGSRAQAQVFGIAREALANVAKHARASTVRIRIEVAHGRVVVEIRDDGRGFDPEQSHPGHFGLESMASRAEEVGGLLTITSAPGQGTAVRIEAPAEQMDASDDGRAR